MKSVSESRNRSALPDAFRQSVPPAAAPDVAPIPGHSHPRAEWQDLVYEFAPLAYLNFDTQGLILDFNVAASQLLGASRKRDIHRPLADFFSPRHHHRLLKHIRQSSTSQVRVVTRLQVRPHNDSGAECEVEITTRPASESLGYHTQIVPIAGDTPIPRPTDDARFRALVENSSEVICIGSPDGTIFYTTPSVQRLLGYTPASWFGRSAFEIMAPECRESVRAAALNLASQPTGSVLRVVTRVRHFDGSWKWVDAVLTNLIGQPAVGGIVCNYRDVTDSRNAEEALRASEQRYRLLAESLPQMITIRSEDGRIEYCNSHWLQYLGFHDTESIVHGWKQGIFPEDDAAVPNPPWNSSVPQPWSGECRIRRASDGAFRWHSVRIIPLPRQGESRPWWLVIANDIHERKQFDQERERLLSQLECERSELAVQYAVNRVLAESSNLHEAAPRLLAAFCDQLGWQAGALWMVGPTGIIDSPLRTLSLLHIHQQPGVGPTEALIQSKPRPLKEGQGLDGRV
jgi:PAS domain S-box-containing protein